MSGTLRIRWSDIMRIRDLKIPLPERGTGSTAKGDSLASSERCPELLLSEDSLSDVSDSRHT